MAETLELMGGPQDGKVVPTTNPTEEYRIPMMLNDPLASWEPSMELMPRWYGVGVYRARHSRNDRGHLLYDWQGIL